VTSTLVEPDARLTARPRVRRLLVISYHFPPDGAVGGLRWAGLSKYLARVGWEVHIVTAAEGPAAVTPGVHRHHCRPRRTLNDRYKAFSARRRDARQASLTNA